MLGTSIATFARAFVRYQTGGESEAITTSGVLRRLTISPFESNPFEVPVSVEVPMTPGRVFECKGASGRLNIGLGVVRSLPILTAPPMSAHPSTADRNVFLMRHGASRENSAATRSFLAAKAANFLKKWKIATGTLRADPSPRF